MCCGQIQCVRRCNLALLSSLCTARFASFMCWRSQNILCTHFFAHLLFNLSILFKMRKPHLPLGARVNLRFLTEHSSESDQSTFQSKHHILIINFGSSLALSAVFCPRQSVSLIYSMGFQSGYFVYETIR